MRQSMALKVLKPFLNPLTNRMAEVDSVVNAPQSIFWLRRLEAEDCKKISKKEVAEAREKAYQKSEKSKKAVSSGKADSKKGSK